MATCTCVCHSSFHTGGVPVIIMKLTSSMFVKWKREKAIGSTPSRSKWFTWDRSMVSTAW